MRGLWAFVSGGLCQQPLVQYLYSVLCSCHSSYSACPAVFSETFSMQNGSFNGSSNTGSKNGRYNGGRPPARWANVVSCMRAPYVSCPLSIYMQCAPHWHASRAAASCIYTCNYLQRNTSIPAMQRLLRVVCCMITSIHYQDLDSSTPPKSALVHTAITPPKDQNIYNHFYCTACLLLCHPCCIIHAGSNPCRRASRMLCWHVKLSPLPPPS